MLLVRLSSEESTSSYNTALLVAVSGARPLGVVVGSVGGWDDAARTSVCWPAFAVVATVGSSAQPLAGQATSVTGGRPKVLPRIEVLPEPAAATAAVSRLSSWLSAMAIRSGSA